MNILLVSSIQIFPPESGGQLRSANLARALNRLGHNVEIYSYTGRRKDYLRWKKSGEHKISARLSEYTNRFFLWGILQQLSYFLKLPPFWIYWLSHFYCPKVLGLKKKRADLVIADFPYLSPLKKRSRVPFFLNTHNAEYELWNKNFIKKLVKEIEIKSFQEADKVFFCHRDDMEKFQPRLPLLQEKTHIIPNGIHLESYQMNSDARQLIRAELGIREDENVFLFVGSKYGPNTEAFQFLRNWSKENIDVLRETKSVILIAGSVYTTILHEKTFKTVGVVKEMSGYFSASDFGLNPVKSGSGTNLKMMEYVAARLPVLTTAFGRRGLTLLDNETCYLFDEHNLKNAIYKAVALNALEREKMAARAYLENHAKLDMSVPLEKAVWV